MNLKILSLYYFYTTFIKLSVFEPESLWAKNLIKKLITIRNDKKTQNQKEQKKESEKERYVFNFDTFIFKDVNRTEQRSSPNKYITIPRFGCWGCCCVSVVISESFKLKLSISPFHHHHLYLVSSTFLGFISGSPVV